MQNRLQTLQFDADVTPIARMLKNVHQEMAIAEFLKPGTTQVDAYRRAYPRKVKNDVRQASQLFRRKDIQGRLMYELKKLQTEAIMVREEFLASATAEARGNMADFEPGFEMKPGDPRGRLVRRLKRRVFVDKRTGEVAGHVEEIELESRQGARDQLAKALGWYAPIQSDVLIHTPDAVLRRLLESELEHGGRPPVSQT